MKVHASFLFPLLPRRSHTHTHTFPQFVHTRKKMAGRPTGRCPIEACRDARLIRRRVRTTKCACNCGASAESLECSGCALLFHRNDACFRLHVAEAELAAALYAKGVVAGAEPLCAVEEPSRKRLRKGSLCSAEPSPSPSLEMSMSMSTMSHNWRRKQSVASMPIHTERPSTTCLMSSSFSSTSTESLTPATSRASTPDHSVACSEDYTAVLGSSSRQLLTSSCLRTLKSPILVTLQNSTTHSLCGFTVARCCTCCTNRLPFTEPRTFSEPVLSLGEETQVLFTKNEIEGSDEAARPGLMHFEVQFSAEGIESSKIYFLVDTKTGVVMLDKHGSTQPECTEWRASVAPMGLGGHHTRLLLAEVSPFAAMVAERRVNSEGRLQVGGAPTAEVPRWDWNAVGHRVRRDEAQHAVAAHPTVGVSRARRFPEMRDAALLQRTSDSAVCLGSVGGSLRSYLCAVGAMRALHGLKLMGRVRYQTAASGGALASASFLYRDESLFSDQEVLGDLLYTSGDLVSAPLSMRRLGRAPSGLMTQAAAREHDAKYARAAQSSETWAEAVSARFLEPVGARSTGVMAWSQQSLNDVLDRNAHLVDGDFAKQNANRPFSVFGSTLVAPAAMLPVSEDAVDAQYAAFESTPLSAGVPVHERSVAYTKVGNASFTQRFWGGKAAPSVETQQAIVGGATVEPIGCGAPLKQRRAADVRGCPSLSAGATALRHTLGGVVAASSSLCAARNVLPGGAVAAVPTTRYAAPLTAGAEAPAEFAVGDGSMVDSLAVLPALRRQVRDVVVFVDPTQARFLDEPDLAAVFARPAGQLQSRAPLHKGSEGDAGSWYACPSLQALFGFESAAKDGVSYAGKTVFDGTFDLGGSRCGDALVHILQTWSRAVHEGRPVVAQTDGLAVLNNTQHGVEAHACNVTWVCLLKAAPAAVLTKVVPDAFDEDEMVIPVTEQDCVCDVRPSGPWANPRNVGFNQYMSDTTWQEYQRTDAEAPFRCLSSPECDGGYSIEAANLLAEYQAWTLGTWLHTDPHGMEVAGRLRR